MLCDTNNTYLMFGDTNAIIINFNKLCHIERSECGERSRNIYVV